MIEKKVEQALRLLSLARGELSLKEAMEIIKSVSKLNEVAYQTLALGEARGIIKRDKKRIYILNEEPLNYRVLRKDCLSHCKRCGKRITKCHFIVVGEDNFGPYGSECIKFISK